MQELKPTLLANVPEGVRFSLTQEHSPQFTKTGPAWTTRDQQERVNVTITGDGFLSLNHNRVVWIDKKQEV